MENTTGNNSLDPRVNRLDLANLKKESVQENENWDTWEVFHQKKRGEQHTHVGIVHAPDAVLAMVFAKEQYARRLNTTSLWVVRSSDVFATTNEEEDMFETTPEKKFRDASGYPVRDKINAYKKLHGITEKVKS
jgi:ring-1,2-phenylacetyl-CoA epoxidase subunit PaaB